MKHLISLVALAAALALTIAACDSGVAPDTVAPEQIAGDAFGKATPECARFTGRTFGLCEAYYAAGCDEDDSKPSCENNPWPCATNGIGMKFTLIEAGTFAMGSTAGNADETPVHDVTISRAFCLGTYEVTQGQWRAVMGEAPPGGFFFDSCPGEVDDNCPAEMVSWFDAIAFANQLSADEGLEVCYDGSGNVVGGGGDIYACSGYRLPTEAEWEYATRAGTTTEWSWGSNGGDADAYAWYFFPGATHPVGGKLANPWGLYDVHGNVREWVHDWYASDYYDISPSIDPTGPASGEIDATGGTSRLRRGGGIVDGTSHLRSAFRFPDYPYFQEFYVGFRLLKAAS